MKHTIWVTWDNTDSALVARKIEQDTHQQATTKHAWLTNNLPTWLTEHAISDAANPDVHLEPNRHCDNCDHDRKRAEQQVDLARIQAQQGAA